MELGHCYRHEGALDDARVLLREALAKLPATAGRARMEAEIEAAKAEAVRLKAASLAPRATSPDTAPAAAPVAHAPAPAVRRGSRHGGARPGNGAGRGGAHNRLICSRPRNACYYRRSSRAVETALIPRISEAEIFAAIWSQALALKGSDLFQLLGIERGFAEDCLTHFCATPPQFKHRRAPRLERTSDGRPESNRGHLYARRLI
jgi:hypothetical protein